MLTFYQPDSRCLPSEVFQNIFNMMITGGEDEDVQAYALPEVKPQPFRLFTELGQGPSMVYGIHQLDQGFLSVVLDFKALQFCVTFFHDREISQLQRMTVAAFADMLSLWLVQTFISDAQHAPPLFPSIQSFWRPSPQPQYAALLLVLQGLLGFNSSQVEHYWQIGYQESLASLFESFKRDATEPPPIPQIDHAVIERKSSTVVLSRASQFITQGTKYLLPECEIGRVRGKSRTDADSVIVALYYLSPVGDGLQRPDVLAADIVGFIHSFKIREPDSRRARDESPRRNNKTLIAGGKISLTEAQLDAKLGQINHTAFADKLLPPALQKLVKTKKSTNVVPGRARDRVFLRLTDRGAEYAESILGFRGRPSNLVAKVTPPKSAVVIVDLIAKYGSMNRAEILQKYIVATNRTENYQDATLQSMKMLLCHAVNRGELIRKREFYSLTTNPEDSWLLRCTLRNSAFEPRDINRTDYGQMLTRAIRQCFADKTALDEDDVYSALYHKVEFKRLQMPALQQVLNQMINPSNPSLVKHGDCYFRIPRNGALFDIDELYRQCNEGWVEQTLQMQGFALPYTALSTAFQTQIFTAECKVPVLRTDERLFIAPSTLPFENVGLGLFAKVELPENTLIEVTGHIQKRQPNDNSFLPYGFSLQKGSEIWEINARPLGCDVLCKAAMANDGLDKRAPNMTQHLIQGLEGRLFLRLLETVAPDTELLWSYGDDYWEAFHERYANIEFDDVDIIQGDIDNLPEYNVFQYSGWKASEPASPCTPPVATRMLLSDKVFMSSLNAADFTVFDGPPLFPNID